MKTISIIFYEKDRRGVLFCFFSKKNESIEPDPIGFRPKSPTNSTTGTPKDIFKLCILKISHIFFFASKDYINQKI